MISDDIEYGNTQAGEFCNHGRCHRQLVRQLVSEGHGNNFTCVPAIADRNSGRHKSGRCFLDIINRSLELAELRVGLNMSIGNGQNGEAARNTRASGQREVLLNGS